MDALVRKTRVALERRGWRSLGLSGGVANNAVLRAALAVEARRAKVDFPAPDGEERISKRPLRMIYSTF